MYAHARWVAGSGRKGTALRGGPLRVRGGWLRAVVGGAGSACRAVRLPTPPPRPAPGRLVPLVLPLFFLESALLTCCAHHCILMCAVTQS